MVRRAGFLAALLVFVAAAARAAGPIRVVVDGRARHFTPPPLLVGGKAMVPIRGTLESVGAHVAWNRSTRTVTITKGNRHVELVVGTRLVRVNHRSVRLNIRPIIRSNSVYVPIRFVSEALGAHVRWDQASRTVSIATGGRAAKFARERTRGPSR